MPLTNVTCTINGETATYLGVAMTELLNQTDASWDAGIINIIAADSHQCTIDTYQAYNSTEYVGKDFIVAFAKNGQWLTDSTDGPLQFIAPGLTPNYNIKNVAEINLEPWIVTINGNVTNPMTLTGANITRYEVKTVQATFAPGGEAQRTSDWTGVTLQSILDDCGVSSDASKITVSAVDDYSRSFLLDTVERTSMMLGYQENGTYLSPEDGQPFRLVIPLEEFKWGQNWVRWVTEITVS